MPRPTWRYLAGVDQARPRRRRRVPLSTPGLSSNVDGPWSRRLGRRRRTAMAQAMMWSRPRRGSPEASPAHRAVRVVRHGHSDVACGNRPVVAASLFASTPSALSVAAGASSAAARHYALDAKAGQGPGSGAQGGASALAASQRGPGVDRMFDDSGKMPHVLCCGRSGAVLGDVPRGAGREERGLGVDRGRAWSAIRAAGRLHWGLSATTIAERREATMIRAPEPGPAPAGTPPANGRTSDAEAFKVQYPNGANGR